MEKKMADMIQTLKVEGLDLIAAGRSAEGQALHAYGEGLERFVKEYGPLIGFARHFARYQNDAAEVWGRSIETDDEAESKFFDERADAAEAAIERAELLAAELGL